MRRVLFAVLLFASTGAMSQGFQLGIKGGVNISNFTGGDFQDVKKSSLVGFNAGAFLGFLLGDHFSIQPEVLFSTQGAKFESAGDKQDYKVSYLNVPVLAKYRFTGGFYLEAGPQVGFKLNENIPDQTIDHFAKNLDLSVAGGLGFHSSMGLGIGARYTAGLSKVGDYSSDTEPNFKNGVAQVFIFYTLFNNKK